MSEDTITRDEFQLYHQAQEKERLVDRIKDSLNWDRGLATLSGVAAAACGLGIVYYQMHQDNPTMVAVEAVFTLANAGVLVYRSGVIADKHKQVGRLETELEQIKENPAYKKLDLSE